MLNIELRMDREIHLFDTKSETLVIIKPYRRNERVAVAIDAPMTVRIDQQRQGVGGNGSKR